MLLCDCDFACMTSDATIANCKRRQEACGVKFNRTSHCATSCQVFEDIRAPKHLKGSILVDGMKEG